MDICIGVNDDWSRPSDEIIERAVSFFSSKGYSAVVNNPYSNSVSPKMGFNYPSLMIELNKGTYLHGVDEMDYCKALSVRNCMEEFFRIVLE